MTLSSWARGAGLGILASLLFSTTQVAGGELRLIVPADPSCMAPGLASSRTVALPHLVNAVASRKSVRIIAIGSSSTAGIGASSGISTYPAQLETMLDAAKVVDFDVVNMGVSGEVASVTAKRIEAEVVRQDPSLVLWQVGTNDAMAQVPTEEFERTVTNTLHFLKDHGYDTMLVGMQWTRRLSGNVHYTEIKDALARVAAAENVTLVSRYDSMHALVEAHGKEDLLSADQFHLNDYGYHCMANQVAVTMASAMSAMPEKSLTTAVAVH